MKRTARLSLKVDVIIDLDSLTRFLKFGCGPEDLVDEIKSAIQTIPPETHSAVYDLELDLPQCREEVEKLVRKVGEEVGAWRESR